MEWYDAWNGLIEEYDKVYVSKVFSFSPDYEHPIYAKEVQYGGSGYCIKLVDGKEIYDKSKDKDLPYEIEHIYPDYSLYPNMTKGIAYGFLTRGCPRGCAFCHVAAKEGRCAVKVADVKDFWTPDIGKNHIDALPIGDMVETVKTLIQGSPEIDFVFCPTG